MAKMATKSQFSQRLLNPTAGTRNLMRCIEGKPSPVLGPGFCIPAPSNSPTIKSITAKDLLQQHKQQMMVLKAKQTSQQQQPQLGRGLQNEQHEIDLSPAPEVCLKMI